MIVLVFLVINSKILDYGLWHVRYFCWVKFTNLDPFLINKIYWTNLKFEFVLEYLLWILYISRYLHLNYFCFCMNPFCNSVSWVWIYDTWRMEFHEKKWDLKSCKWSIELVISLLGYTFYFSLIFDLFLLVSVNINLYIFTHCVQNWISNKLEILFK